MKFSTWNKKDKFVNKQTADKLIIKMRIVVELHKLASNLITCEIAIEASSTVTQKL